MEEAVCWWCEKGEVEVPQLFIGNRGACICIECALVCVETAIGKTNPEEPEGSFFGKVKEFFEGPRR